MHLKTLIAAVAALTLPGAASAQHGPEGHGGGPPPGFTGGHFAAGPVVGRLGARDLATWRSGWWWHGWRGGRVGWWWCAGGFWYWYPAPIYPDPTYVAGDVVGDAPAPGAAWWWCDDPPGYFPYVQSCWRWRPVAPTYGPG